MVEETFSITEAWDIEPPCYVRKVDRPGHWQDAETIQAKVLRPEPKDGTISLYRISSAIDLVRVAIALNANRSSFTERIYLAAIAEEEMIGLIIRQTKGQTLCKWANHLHRDLVLSAQHQVGHLAKALVAAERKPKTFNKSAMQKALDFANAERCYAVQPDSVECTCERDLPKAGLWSLSVAFLQNLVRRIAALLMP